MNYIVRGVHHAGKGIRQHPRLMVVLLLLQFLMLGLVLGIGVYYQYLIFSDIQGVIQPLQRANYDTTQLQEGKVFTTEMADVYKSYTALKTHMWELVGWFVFIIIVLNGIIWVLCHRVLAPLSWKSHILQWCKFAGIALGGLIPIAGIGYTILRSLVLSQVSPQTVSTAVKSIGGVAAIVLYFVLVGIALLPASSWKEFWRLWVHASIKKIHKTLLVLLINVLILGLIVVGLYYSVMLFWPFWAMISFVLLFVIAMVWVRLFWIAAVQEVAHETHHP